MFEFHGIGRLDSQRRGREESEWSGGDLPPGIRQATCDGPVDPQANADDDQLWQACDDARQTKMAEEFVHARREDVRDAILEAHDTGTADELGRSLWKSWLNFRQLSLNRLHRRGELRAI